MVVSNEKREISGVAGHDDNSYQPEILNIIKLNINKSGAPILILQQVQELVGYLPYFALNTISRETDIPLSKLYSIITFYHYFIFITRYDRRRDNPACASSIFPTVNIGCIGNPF